MITTTLERLRGLRLGALADAYLAHQHDPAVQGLSFDERFSMLVDAEHLFRDGLITMRGMRSASMPTYVIISLMTGSCRLRL